MKKYIVTGGAGFIGSHLVKRLVDKGGDVTIVDNLSRGKLQNLTDLGIEDVQVRNIDLREHRNCNRIKDADIIYHLAARVGGIEYMHKNEYAELEALQDNLLIDTNVFRTALVSGMDKIIYASSVSVYPMDLQNRPDTILSENDFYKYNPEGGYGWAKLMGEKQLNWMEDINIGIARIFNVYGECEPLDETTYMVPALIKKAVLYPKEEFIVWGNGNQTRSLLYVSDCIDALLKLEEKTASPPLVVNIGSDKPTSIKKVAETIANISDKNMKIIYDLTKPVGALSRTADLRKVKEALNWKPTVSLDEGLERTYNWAKRRLSKC